jgi:hypothetical protein
LLYQNKLAEAKRVIESQLARSGQSSSGRKVNLLFFMKFETRLLQVHLRKEIKQDAEELRTDLWRLWSELEFGKNHRNTFKVKREAMRAYKYQGRDTKAKEIKKEIIRYRRRNYICIVFPTWKFILMITWIWLLKRVH